MARNRHLMRCARGPQPTPNLACASPGIRRTAAEEVATPDHAEPALPIQGLHVQGERRVIHGGASAQAVQIHQSSARRSTRDRIGWEKEPKLRNKRRQPLGRPSLPAHIVGKVEQRGPAWVGLVDGERAKHVTPYFTSHRLIPEAFTASMVLLHLCTPMVLHLGRELWPRALTQYAGEKCTPSAPPKWRACQRYLASLRPRSNRAPPVATTRSCQSSAGLGGNLLRPRRRA
eukprot:scaffold1839_cov382-Prasinococcus_capsulatus_cf.AAC.43